jgi:MFS transporter, ACS family, glucarate transporter
VCLDLGGRNAGAIVGLMNTAAQAGGFVSSIAFGYIVNRSGSYDAPFVPMALLLFLGAGFWLGIDASREVSISSAPAPVPRSRLSAE